MVLIPNDFGISLVGFGERILCPARIETSTSAYVPANVGLRLATAHIIPVGGYVRGCEPSLFAANVPHIFRACWAKTPHMFWPQFMQPLIYSISF